jgi:hypothetical protein
MRYVPWILSGMSIIGAVLNVLYLPICFVIWTVASLAWIWYNVRMGTWAQVPMWVVFTATNVWGYYMWTRPVTSCLIPF